MENYFYNTTSSNDVTIYIVLLLVSKVEIYGFENCNSYDPIRATSISPEVSLLQMVTLMQIGKVRYFSSHCCRDCICLILGTYKETIYLVKCHSMG